MLKRFSERSLHIESYREIETIPPTFVLRWTPATQQPLRDEKSFQKAARNLDETLVLVETPKGTALARGGNFVALSEPAQEQASYGVLQIIPPFHAWDLGCPSFKKSWGLRYAYVMGSMARGISSLEMVKAAAEGGMLGFFGAAGMMPQEVARWVDRANREIAPRPFGFNLIHSPFDSDLESRLVEIYLTAGIDRVEASAFMGITPALVRYRLSGIHTDPSGTIVCPNRVMAKISREEVAQKFLSPAPEKILVQLVATGALSRRQAELSRHVPMCDAITAEADSGGHTDNRPAIALFPTIVTLRDRMAIQHGYDRRIPVGLAGGIGTPHAVAAAFAMGADYIQTGSINQSCVESGVAPEIRKLLCETRQADVAMAPSADMFEMGVKVQVLKRGTWFAQKAQKLYDLYTRYEGLEALPKTARQSLEKDFFCKSIEEEWQSTRAFFEARKPDEIHRAEHDPKHRMALLFRSYLGQSSLWAKQAVRERRMDYQIWCGPAMGAFNAWAAGTPFENPENRKVVDVALRLMNDAAALQRMQWIRTALQQSVRHDPADCSFPGLASPPLGGIPDGDSGRTGDGQ